MPANKLMQSTPLGIPKIVAILKVGFTSIVQQVAVEPDSLAVEHYFNAGPIVLDEKAVLVPAVGANG